MNEPGINSQTSCMDDFDPQSLAADTALHRILGAINPLSATECVVVRQALDRVLATDLISGMDVPAHTNSAMDGYALAASDLPAAGTRELKVAGTALAGKPYPQALTPGHCVRIMTGAVLPDAADTVIIQENVTVEGDHIRIGTDTQPGANVRQAGEDIAAGDTVLTRGTRLTPADLGLVASLGISEIAVARKPRIAFFSTGDELQSVGEELAIGNVYDSNRYTLHGMLSRLNAEIIDLGVVRDNRADLEAAFHEASAQADMVITSGGVSVGEADYVREILSRLGQVNFWKVAIKPGRPLAFGNIGPAIFFGLPGNPVSVMVTFYQFVQPAILKLMGARHVQPVTVRAICNSKLKKRAGRVEYQRGIVELNADNRLVVSKTGAQGSGILTSMAQANCFIILPMESTGVQPGDDVDIQLFFGLV